MVDITEIQKEINSNKTARKEFETDPAAYLAKKGITLSADQLAAIKTQLKNAAPGQVQSWNFGV